MVREGLYERDMGAWTIQGPTVTCNFSFVWSRVR
jgi:hypothetical protein